MGYLYKATALMAAGFLAGCGDPLDGFPTLSDVRLAEDAPVAEIAESSPETPNIGNWINGLLSGSDAPVEATPTEDLVAGEAPLDDVGVLELDPVPLEPPAQSGGGFLSLLGLESPDTTVPIETNFAPQSVEPGAVLPYGELAVVCGIRARNLGTAVETASGYTVYDTNPTSTAPRTQFITGFADGCARQMTATLALFGDIGTHEFVRYGSGYAGLPYSDTDRAYEEIKAGFCRVSQGTPCGSRIDRLSQRTTFLTIYERFGGNGRWVELLLHNGEVVALDFEGN